MEYSFSPERRNHHQLSVCLGLHGKKPVTPLSPSPSLLWPPFSKVFWVQGWHRMPGELIPLSSAAGKPRELLGNKNPFLP